MIRSTKTQTGTSSAASGPPHPPETPIRSRRVRIPISWKLLAASVIVGAIATGLAIHGLRRMHALNERLTRLVDYTAAKVKLAALLKQDLVTITRAERNLILTPSVEEMQRFADAIDETLSVMKRHQDQLLELANDKDCEALDAFTEQWNEWQRVHHDVRSFAQLKSDVRARDLALGKGRESFRQFETALTDIIAAIAASSRRENAPADEQRRALQQMNLIAEVLMDSARIQRSEELMILAHNAGELREIEESLAPLEEGIQSRFRALTDLTREGEQPALVRAQVAFQEYLGLLAEIRATLGEKGNFFVYQFADEIGGPLAIECERLLDEVISQSETDLQTSRHDSRESYVSSRNALLGLSAIGIVVSVTVTYFTGQRIAVNLGRLADYTRALEDTGDLSRPVPQVSRDEVGLLADSFERLRTSLHRQTSELATLNLALEQKNKEMEQFVYTVSHDLSSPLVSCKGLVGLMKEDIESGNYDEVIASAKRLDGAVDQLRRIIDDLLKLSRIGRKPLRKEEIDVEALLTNLKDGLTGRLLDVHAELRIDTPLPTVLADISDLARVFDNFVANALKYACDGEKRVITIGGMTFGDEVRFFVRDTGPGIEPKYHRQIFGLFQRLDNAKPGTGVGLASVEKIMRMHGGRSWVESTPGHGATFWIAFPKESQVPGPGLVSLRT